MKKRHWISTALTTGHTKEWWQKRKNKKIDNHTFLDFIFDVLSFYKSELIFLTL